MLCYVMLCYVMLFYVKSVLQSKNQGKGLGPVIVDYAIYACMDARMQSHEIY